MIPLPLRIDDESFSMQDNDLDQSTNNPIQQKVETKPRSSKFQSFNKFPKLFATCQEDEYHQYDYPSSSKYSVELQDDPSLCSGNNNTNSQTGKQKVRPSLTNHINSLVIMVELSKLNTIYVLNQKGSLTFLIITI